MICGQEDANEKGTWREEVRVFRGSPLAPDPVCGSEFVKPISFRDHGRMAAS